MNACDSSLIGEASHRHGQIAGSSDPDPKTGGTDGPVTYVVSSPVRADGLPLSERLLPNHA